MPTGYPISITKNLRTWRFNQATVERPTDNATYQAAHPDDTLIMAGPARRSVIRSTTGSPLSLMALGMLQSISIQTQVPVQPLQAIGSGRSFFLRGKSQSSWQMARVMINGRNLLRGLYHNAVESGVQVSRFDDPASLDEAPRSQFFVNMDSELYYIPIGLGCVIRSKDFSLVASMYMELSLISSWSLQFTAGNPIIAENVQGLCDRVLPFQPSEALSLPQVGRATMDAVLGLGPNVFPNGSSYQADRMNQFDDSGLNDGTVPLSS
jgi:hypothetical protein